MTDELIERLRAATFTKGKSRGGAGGQTIEESTRSTFHEVSAWDLDEAAATIEAQAARIAELEAKSAKPTFDDFNDWWLSLPEGRQNILREDKWMLSAAAFDAAYQSTPSPTDPVRDAAGELLEALKDMTDLASALTSATIFVGGRYINVRDATKKAHTAIRRAEGGQG